MSPLKGADGMIYALAQGNVVVGGAGASSGGSKAQVNHLSVGRIPSGATIEREVPNGFANSEVVSLNLQESDFTTANRMVQAINKQFGAGAARAVDGGTIEVRAPQDSNARIQFLSQLENIAVEPAEVAPLGHHQCPYRVHRDEPSGQDRALCHCARQLVGNGEW